MMADDVAINAGAAGGPQHAVGLEADGTASTWRQNGSIPNKDAGLPDSVAVWGHCMDLKHARSKVDDLVGENYLALFPDFC